MTEIIYEQLSFLRLHGMKNELIRQQSLPSITSLSFEERLAMMIQYQVDLKKDSKTKRLLRLATLREPTASLKHIRYTPMRNIEKSLIARLSTSSYIAENQHIILTGATGTGKSYIASALGREACIAGYRVKCYRLPRLLVELATSKADGSFFKLMQQLKNPDLLILDDFGLQKLEPEACRDLLEVIEDRYIVKKPLILTSQLPLNQWIQLFKDLTIADAILDRVVHNCFKIELKGPSLRGPDQANSSHIIDDEKEIE